MNNLSYWQVTEIIERIEFIKGNVIADQQRDAIQQIKELLQYVEDIKESIMKSGYPGK